MAMRMSGLISGLDTDSIITQLVSAKRTKVTKAEGEQTKLSWKQEIWSDLNKQLKSLQSTLGNMRFSTAYQKKTTNVSNSSKASVITGSTAVNSVQSLKIKQLAKSGYLTGGVVSASDSDGNTTTATALSKLSDLGYTGGETTLNISTNGTTSSVTINGDSTISDVLNALKDQGLNASFDEGNQRLFVSSKTTGAASDFSITASSSDGQSALDALGLTTYDDTTVASYKSYASYTATDVAKEALSRAQDAADSYKKYASELKTAKESLAELQDKNLKSVSEYEAEIESATESVSDIQKQIDELSDDATDEEKSSLQDRLKEAQENLDTLNSNKSDAEKLATLQETTIPDLESKISEAQSKFTGDPVYDDDGNIVSYDNVTASDELIESVQNEFAARAAYANEKLAELESGATSSTGATKITGRDAIIELNGATFTNTTNVFSVNGLTITAMGTTADDEEITLTTSNDTSGIYDMVKSFLKSYNTIINKMDELYNADSSSDYSPLTDDEKDALSDTEVEEYEKKIKDGLLKSDSTINSITSALTSIMAGGITVNGKTMYLSSFGISTLDYFDAEDNEKHAYHIDGDSDDSSTSGNSDKLLSMITSDPDTVTSFFSKLSQNLYDKMSDLSSRVSGYRSYGSFFNDTKMSSDYSKYTSQISELEDKANDYEDNLYSKFSSMETALAKLQSNSSAVTSLLGS